MTSKTEGKTRSTKTQRRQYATPKLVIHGDVRQLTQGGLSGDIESMNNNSSFRP
jgi:hypothetical protein